MTQPSKVIPAAAAQGAGPQRRIAYKWIVLSCTTLGVFMAVINGSSLLIALPAIFRGIHLSPLDPGNFTYLLWILMGYGLVSAALVVTAGRIGDMFGRVRMFKIGFIIFTAAAVGLSLVWGTGAAGAIQIIAFRMVQAVGGAMMMANSAAILTDVFPSDQRGMALGINGVSLLAGSFLGLIAGGLLAAVDWRLVFLFNVPIGIVGIVWAYWQLREVGERHRARIDWLGNLTFAAGLVVLLTGITYGIKPYGTLQHGLVEPLRDQRDHRRPRLAGGVRLHRAPRRGADVQPQAVSHPRLRRRQPRRAALVDRQRRHAVHADHVAAGHLAAAARLQLRADAAVGRHLHAAPDVGLPGRRARSRASSPTATARVPSPPPACCSPRSASCC